MGRIVGWILSIIAIIYAVKVFKKLREQHTPENTNENINLIAVLPWTAVIAAALITVGYYVAQMIWGVDWIMDHPWIDFFYMVGSALIGWLISYCVGVKGVHGTKRKIAWDIATGALVGGIAAWLVQHYIIEKYVDGPATLEKIAAWVLCIVLCEVLVNRANIKALREAGII